MVNEVYLKDGTLVKIRPLRDSDFENSLTFFQSLAPEDMWSYGKNLAHTENLKGYFAEGKSDRVMQFVAEVDGKIVGEGTIELDSNGWKMPVAEVQIVTAIEFRHKGLGTEIASELYLKACKDHIDKLTVKMHSSQIDAYHIFKKLGFYEDTTLTGLARNVGGERRDAVVMKCEVESYLEKLEEYYIDSDWERRK